MIPQEIRQRKSITTSESGLLLSSFNKLCFNCSRGRSLISLNIVCGRRCTYITPQGHPRALDSRLGNREHTRGSWGTHFWLPPPEEDITHLRWWGPLSGFLARRTRRCSVLRGDWSSMQGLMYSNQGDPERIAPLFSGQLRIVVSLIIHRKHRTSAQCLFSVGPASATLAQH